MSEIIIDGGRMAGVTTLKKEIDHLKQENEALRRAIKDINIVKVVEQNEQYKQALEEIREIVNDPCIEGEDCNTCVFNCPTKEIIDKINEVLK